MYDRICLPPYSEPLIKERAECHITIYNLYLMDLQNSKKSMLINNILVLCWYKCKHSKVSIAVFIF